MNPEVFTQELLEALGERLMTVALYGSAVAEDVSKQHSNVNLLVVCDRLGLPELDLLSPLAVKWARAGNPPPLFFTHERLLNSSHVFPIELLDIKENHRILYGTNVLRALPINQENLQFQLEHELKGKLIQLRENYLLISHSDGEVLDLMFQSLSAFQVMAKASLRFYVVDVPVKKREAVKLLSRHVFFDVSIFEELQALREGVGALSHSGEQMRELFARYLDTIEHLADQIAGLGRKRE